ncbi:MAG: methionine ABC transporter ATP-binding protein, partial [Spirochaetota bacterium]
MGGEAVLEVRDLCTHFSLRGGLLKAVDGVSLRVGRGEVLGIAGESGSGK